ncbi:MAG: hypothetical protein RBG13Loki_0889 [Promethearchaeota archaeon CR_4]|nr:MAG: hypothetical protein RBG13Loki_0889 [Candidatus Lokiarchaeota archaeon CR_4]
MHMGINFRWTKKNAVLATVMVILTATIPFIDSGSAWKNGSYAYNSASYSYSDDFGTHDWVAEAALNALYSVDKSNWQWLMDRKTIFLVGTEAPDNSGVSMTLDGTAVSGFGDTTKHHIYFNEDGTISNNEDDAAIRAKTVGDLADVAMDADKYDLAAFYLGTMTHYIADMGVFCHVAENNVAPHYLDFDKNHTEFEDYVGSRTNNHANPEEFFQIASFSINSTTPYNAAKNLAWDTYKDPTGSHDAKYLYDNFFGSWVLTFAARSGDSSEHRTYYNRVEQNLNNAIAACAAAINSALGIGSTGNTGVTDGMPAYPLPIFVAFATIAMLGLIGRKSRKISK